MLPLARGMGARAALATDARWSALKDAFYAMLVARSRGEKPAPRPFTLALAGLSGADVPALDERVFDLGVDAGRHVYAKSIKEDSLAEALARLGDGFAEADLGGSRVLDVFHRSATLAFDPQGLGAQASATLLAAHVSGVLTGALAEAFNCRVEVRSEGERAYHVRLAEGRVVDEVKG